MSTVPPTAFNSMIAVSDLASGPIFPAEPAHVTTAANLPPLPPRRVALHYCLVLLLLTLFVIPACIRLGYSDFFLHHGASIWVQSNDSIFNVHDRQCDVLIYGDSTAMTGINPEVVERNTGLKTCNISVTNSVLSVTHNLTLNRYLANNPRPRVLLVQLSPDGFQPESNSWTNTVYPEGLLELLRHGTPAETRRVLVHHPREAIAFAGYAAGFTMYSLGKDAWFHLTHSGPREDAVIIHNGFFTPPSPPTTSCEPGATFSNPSAGGAFPRSVVGEYVNDYAARSGIVLVNVAPIPACDQNLKAFAAELNGITSNSVLPLPVTLFNDPRHYTAVGSAIVSRLIAEEVNAVAQHNSQVYEQADESLPPRDVASLHLAALSR